MNRGARSIPTPLTDTSPEGLRAAIEADVIATRLSNVDVPVSAHLDDDAAWAIAPDPGSLRSTIVWAAFDPGAADRRIAEILATVDAAGTPVLWWLAPHHRPDDLARRLPAHGFRLVDRTAAMAMPLADVPAPGEAPSGLSIRPVRDAVDARAFVDVISTDRPEGAPSAPPGTADLRIRHIVERTATDPAPMRFVGWIGERPVATSRLSVVGGTAGLYAVVTVPDARGRGIGRAMTLAALEAGRALGMRIATLQATELGLPVYRRIGFETSYHYDLWLRPRAGDRR